MKGKQNPAGRPRKRTGVIMLIDKDTVTSLLPPILLPLITLWSYKLNDTEGLARWWRRRHLKINDGFA
jgi:hypothetical protein